MKTRHSKKRRVVDLPSEDEIDASDSEDVMRSQFEMMILLLINHLLMLICYLRLVYFSHFFMFQILIIIIFSYFLMIYSC